MTKKSKVMDFVEEDVKSIQYHPLFKTEQWRMVIIKEVLEMKSGERELPEDWSWQQLEDVLEVACTS